MRCKRTFGFYVFLLLSLFLSSTGYGQAADTLVVRFGLGRSTLSEGGKAAIDSVLALYDHGRRLTGIELSGYCDTIGSDAYNDRLSRSRTEATRDYLHSKNLPDSLFQRLQGYGKRRPLNDNGNEEKRSLNRRVEIIFHGVERSSVTGKGPEPLVTLPVTAVRPADSSLIPSPPKQEPGPIPLSDALTDTAALVGKNIVLRNVNFYGDRHVPVPSSFFELEKLSQLMLAHPGLRIEIQGYVCCMPETMDGYDADTRKPALSAQRAKFVYHYLIDKGVSASRMSYKGFGGSHKLYPEESNERERALNRRVEIKVLSW